MSAKIQQIYNILKQDMMVRGSISVHDFIRYETLEQKQALLDKILYENSYDMWTHNPYYTEQYYFTIPNSMMKTIMRLFEYGCQYNFSPIRNVNPSVCLIINNQIQNYIDNNVKNKSSLYIACNTNNTHAVTQLLQIDHIINNDIYMSILNNTERNTEAIHLLQNSMKPWKPLRNSLYPISFTNIVMLLLLIFYRRFNEGIVTLPDEMIHSILYRCSRYQFSILEITK
uniref:Uncharacterized protein n=1 Tax=Megaviridae environmental sample TaxID=1737588 RepID=A0A5J6VJM8_9VIRU|nr:MAG: hypothetical protein [Megaviridae environmental sample]